MARYSTVNPEAISAKIGTWSYLQPLNTVLKFSDNLMKIIKTNNQYNSKKYKIIFVVAMIIYTENCSLLRAFRITADPGMTQGAVLLTPMQSNMQV